MAGPGAFGTILFFFWFFRDPVLQYGFRADKKIDPPKKHTGTGYVHCETLETDKKCKTSRFRTYRGTEG